MVFRDSMDSQCMSLPFHVPILEVCGRKSSAGINNNHNDTAVEIRRRSCRGGDGGGGEGGLWQQVENSATV